MGIISNWVLGRYAGRVPPGAAVPQERGLAKITGAIRCRTAPAHRFAPLAAVWWACNLLKVACHFSEGLDSFFFFDKFCL